MKVYDHIARVMLAAFLPTPVVAMDLLLQAEAPQDHSLLILTLGAHELNLSSQSSGVLFDIDLDGSFERVSWPRRSDEYFLALDTNKNVKIDGASELFGSSFLLPEGVEATQGFGALLNFDENNDGLIDENDSEFKHLRAWKDNNHNGILEDHELRDLSSLNISSLDTGYVAMPKLDRYGNEHSLYSRITLTNGSIRSFVEVWFKSLK